MQNSVVSVVLPSTANTARLIELSRAVGRGSPSLIALGEDAIPHITLVQFSAPRTTLNELWDEVSQLGNPVQTITAAGLSFVPQRNDAKVWIEVSFLRSAELMRLHEALLTTAYAATYGPAINSSKGNFRPHCTVGLVEGYHVPGIKLHDYELLRQDLSDLVLAAGINGEHFTLQKVYGSC